MASDRASQVGLLDLPPEIRLKIYRDCFPHPLRKVVMLDIPSCLFFVTHCAWPLFQTCRQIHSEVACEYYDLATFTFGSLGVLRQATTKHNFFRTHARHIVLRQCPGLICAADLLTMPNLRTFTATSDSYRLPRDFHWDDALSYAVLRRALDEPVGKRASKISTEKMLKLLAKLENVVKSKGRNIRFALRFQYTLRPNECIAMIEYDLADDVFFQVDINGSRMKPMTRPTR